MMKKLLLPLLFFSVCVQADIYAWWVTITFKAKETVIEGIPVNKINPSWKLATLLSRSIVPLEALASDDMDPMKELNYRFVIEKDINRDGKAEKILTGVYQDQNKLEGRFVLVLEKKNNKWEKSFLYSSNDKPGFSVLNETEEGVIYWTFCMECGMAGYLKWDGNKFFIEWQNEDYG